MSLRDTFKRVMKTNMQTELDDLNMCSLGASHLNTNVQKEHFYTFDYNFKVSVSMLIESTNPIVLHVAQKFHRNDVIKIDPSVDWL